MKLDLLYQGWPSFLSINNLRGMPFQTIFNFFCWGWPRFQRNILIYLYDSSKARFWENLITLLYRASEIRLCLVSSVDHIQLPSVGQEHWWTRPPACHNFWGHPELRIIFSYETMSVPPPCNDVIYPSPPPPHLLPEFCPDQVHPIAQDLPSMSTFLRQGPHWCNRYIWWGGTGYANT